MKLKVGGKPIEGESSERLFEKQIVLDSLEWDTSVTHEPVLDKKDTRKVKTTNKPKRLTITKAFDRSSTSLCTHVAAQTPFNDAVITMVKSASWDKEGAIPRKFIEMTLNGGLIESVSMAASESGLAVGVREIVTFSFRTMQIVYHPDAVDGARGEMPATTFDLPLPSVND
jgi:type VI protein secretion system component Hcp